MAPSMDRRQERLSLPTRERPIQFHRDRLPKPNLSSVTLLQETEAVTQAWTDYNDVLTGIKNRTGPHSLRLPILKPLTRLQ